MYFSLLPPEIISANMYAGPGSASLIAAATAWGRLASELSTAASEYNAVLASLTGESWTGPSATAMAAAAQPFTAWMSTTAATAAQAATQAQAAATAYEAAHAATVPPEVVTANRTQNQMLYATNFLGQNLAAIAANEAQYLEMWAQDAAAMQTYAASAAAATKITAFTEPPQTTTGTAEATSAAANAGPAAATAGSNPIVDFFAQLATQYNTFVNNLLVQLTGNPSAPANFASVFSALKGPAGLTTPFNDISLLTNFPIQNALKFGTPVGRVFEGLPLSGLGAGIRAGTASAGLASTVSATMSEANLVGNLSVPPSWASASPAIRLAATGAPAAALAAAPASGMAGGMLNQAALGSMAGGALGTARPRTVGGSGRIRIQGGKAKTPVKLDAVIAKLQSQPEAVQHWNVDQAGLDELLDELSRKPGVHAVHLKGAKKAAAPLS